MNQKGQVFSVVFWLRLARGAILLYGMFVLACSLAGALLFPAFAQAHPEQFKPNDQWSSALVQAALNELGWPPTVPAYVDLARNLLFLLTGSSLGLLLIWRGKLSPFILYLAFVFFSFSAGEAFFTPLLAVLPALQIYTGFVSQSAWQFLFILFFWFPNGRPVPAWTGWLAAAWLVFVFTLPFLNQQDLKDWSWFYLIPALIACGSQVYRYFWRSDPIQRQQTKWVIAVIVLIAIFVGIIAPFGFSYLNETRLGMSLILSFVNLLMFNVLVALFPLTVTMAVLRYRLFDIDAILRRTIVYAILTLLLGLVYYGLVLVLGQVFLSASGQRSPLVIVISTLVIAALFNPLRGRIQRFIDRSFYRSRYDAAQAVSEFTQAARSQIELEALAGSLASAAQDSLQPEGISVWIRGRAHQSPTAQAGSPRLEN